MASSFISHADISRALATLGERAGTVEIASSLQSEWEPFEAQMRRRVRTRGTQNRDAYLCLARAGAGKVRIHLEATGVIAKCEDKARRGPGIVVRVRDGRRRNRRRGRADRC
ncbi:MAG TPA: hypothetical protein VFU11_05230 [Solirubrobacterales bacterium]|nr:hypothetical protein [Solirubrobacterales bacterium]